MPAEPIATPPVDEGLDPTIMALIGAVDPSTEAAAKAETPPPEEESTRGRSLLDAIDDPTPPAPKPDDKKPAAAPVVEPPPAPEKTIKVRKRAPEPVAPPPPAPVYTPPVKPTKTAEQEFEEALLPEEREQLENARYAEAKFPGKHTGLAAKTAKFLKDHAAKLNDPAFDPEGDDYKQWLAKNAVALTPRDAREIERERDRETIRAETKAQLSEQDDATFRQIEEPKVKQRADGFYATLANEAIPADLLKSIQTEGMAVAEKKFPIEFKIASDLTTAATNDIEEFMRITHVNTRTGRTLRAYDPANEQHTRLISFVNSACEAFKAGGKGLVKNGQQFLTREEYFSIKDRNQRAAYWTFSNDDIIAQARVTTKQSIAKRIDAEHARLKEMGFTRTIPGSGTPPAGTPPAGSPPAPRGAPIPTEGAAQEDAIDPLISRLYGS